MKYNIPGTVGVEGSLSSIFPFTLLLGPKTRSKPTRDANLGLFFDFQLC